MVKVQFSDNESVDKALKRFKKKLEKSGVLKEYRNRRFFIKPSIERREEVIKAAYKQKMRSQEENQ
ncbi:MAG: 30S ribosomal protein S21 [Bacteroidota bacterium]|nr:30S ribosomal protein S21 [Bacteroidota bacterium]